LLNDIELSSFAIVGAISGNVKFSGG